jgi:ABC-type dipeptide/oligopeptide/nickel transport system permease subunit
MNHPGQRILKLLSLAVLALLLGLSLIASWLPAGSTASWFALGVRAFALATATLAVVGLAVGLPLGIVAAAGPRAADGTLAALCDLCGVLPAVFVLTVAKFSAPGLLGSLCVAGAARGLGFAWVLRSELSRAFAEESEAVARNLGHGPLLVFFRERVARALGPILTSASLSGAWLVAVEAVAVRIGLGPITSHASFGAGLGRGEHGPAAVLAVALGTGALYVLARSAGARLAQGHDSEPFALVRR